MVTGVEYFRSGPDFCELHGSGIEEEKNMGDVVAALRRRRVVVVVAYDIMAWFAAFAVFAWLRYDGASALVPWGDVASLAAASVAVYLAAGALLHLHQGRAANASLDEMILLGVATVGAGTAVFLANWFGQWVPRTVPAGATFGTLVLAAWGRALWRRLHERELEAFRGEGATRVVVIGAGDAGRELLGSMLRDSSRTWHPVGLLDDDPRMRHRRVRSLPVLGTTSELARVVEETRADAVVIAIPSASAGTINRLRVAAVAAGVAVKVLPSTTQLLRDSVDIQDLRDIDLSDVLGRKQLDTEVASIADYLSGRRVLVTGAGGSIGSELCRQIHQFGPSELMMLDRDESALHAVQLSIHGRALLDSDDVILCDIRDEKAVRRVFAGRRPDVVFHAAALKHLPMLEQYPDEALKTNVHGTRVVLDAADLVGVDRFVNISTDKAANPSSVLGFSKRIAERITAQRALQAEGTFLSVRFGNVLGSRGSVLATFAKQIASGGPLTVTDPEVTRYFMTIEEACQLVIQAAAIGQPGEALVLDMGEPVRIADVARQLMEQAGSPVAIEYTGLRRGEKLHEELFGDDEPRDVRPAHRLISHVPVPPVDDRAIDSLAEEGDRVALRRALADLCLVRTSEYARLT
jgi:FlaA1/EpsC-like NDP-sugar epimerase